MANAPAAALQSAVPDAEKITRDAATRDAEAKQAKITEEKERREEIEAIFDRQIQEIEADPDIPPAEKRKLVQEMIRDKHTAIAARASTSSAAYAAAASSEDADDVAMAEEVQEEAYFDAVEDEEEWLKRLREEEEYQAHQKWLTEEAIASANDHEWEILGDYPGVAAVNQEHEAQLTQQAIADAGTHAWEFSGNYPGAVTTEKAPTPNDWTITAADGAAWDFKTTPEPKGAPPATAMAGLSDEILRQARWEGKGMAETGVVGHAPAASESDAAATANLATPLTVAGVGLNKLERGV